MFCILTSRDTLMSSWFPGVDFISSITTNGYYMLHSHRVGGCQWQDSIALISFCILAFDGTQGIQYVQESIRRS